MSQSPIEWLKGLRGRARFSDQDITPEHVDAIVKALCTAYRLAGMYRWATKKAKEEFYEDIIPELRADLGKVFD